MLPVKRIMSWRAYVRSRPVALVGTIVSVGVIEASLLGLVLVWPEALLAHLPQALGGAAARRLFVLRIAGTPHLALIPKSPAWVKAELHDGH